MKKLSSTILTTQLTRWVLTSSPTELQRNLNPPLVTTEVLDNHSEPNLMLNSISSREFRFLKALIGEKFNPRLSLQLKTKVTVGLAGPSPLLNQSNLIGLFIMENCTSSLNNKLLVALAILFTAVVLVDAVVAHPKSPMKASLLTVVLLPSGLIPITHSRESILTVNLIPKLLLLLPNFLGTPTFPPIPMKN